MPENLYFGQECQKLWRFEDFLYIFSVQKTFFKELFEKLSMQNVYNSLKYEIYFFGRNLGHGIWKSPNLVSKNPNSYHICWGYIWNVYKITP
jgi:hypothetical protein